MAFRDPVDALLVCSHSDTPPDLIVLDINMPRIGGLELLAKLRTIPLFKDVPFVLFTSSSRQKYKDDAAALGVTHMVKPLSYDEYPVAARRILEIATRRNNS